MAVWVEKVELGDVWHSFDEHKPGDVDRVAKEVGRRIAKTTWIQGIVESPLRSAWMVNECVQAMINADDMEIDELNDLMGVVWDQADRDRVWIGVL